MGRTKRPRARDATGASIPPPVSAARRAALDRSAAPRRVQRALALAACRRPVDYELARALLPPREYAAWLATEQPEPDAPAPAAYAVVVDCEML